MRKYAIIYADVQRNLERCFEMADKEKELENFDECMLNFSDEALKAVPRISTGFEQLDNLIQGGLGPELTVLGAISSLGKSTFALQIARNISAQNIPVIYFSSEMPKQSIALKMSVQTAFEMVRKEENDYAKCKKAALSSSEISNADKLNTKKAKLRKSAIKKCKEDSSSLYIIERDANRSCFSGELITEIVTAFMESRKVKPVVFVDYLQILTSSEDAVYKNERQIVDKNIADLWLLAKQKGIPVFVISSVNRDSYNKPISFASFKESGGIEFTADVVLGMQFSEISKLDDSQLRKFKADAEKSKDPRQLQVIVLKQRYGRCGEDAYSSFRYYPAYSCFEEYDDTAENNEISKNGENVSRIKYRRKKPSGEIVL